MRDNLKGECFMKMKKLNIKPEMEMLLTVGTVLLTGAQLLLTNKKEANDKAALKAEILKELVKETSEK